MQDSEPANLPVSDCQPGVTSSRSPAARRRAQPGGVLLGISALGIVFGDIGTSPLYTLKTVLNLTGANPQPAAVVGALSLILWTLIIITCVKYVVIAMSVDND